MIRPGRPKETIKSSVSEVRQFFEAIDKVGLTIKEAQKILQERFPHAPSYRTLQEWRRGTHVPKTSSFDAWLEAMGDARVNRRNPSVTSKIMSQVKSGNSATEVALRKDLHSRHLRFRLHYQGLLGKPDIVFVSPRVAVFCDGDFWHGRDWSPEAARIKFGAKSSYWVPKISANIERDKAVTTRLSDDGWLVLRYWESDIRNNVHEIGQEIAQFVNQRRN